jgi:hypothetical protein
VKIGVPVSATSNLSIGSVTTSGYSTYTAQRYENMPTHGFSTYSNVKSSDKLELGVSGALALETGIKLRMSGGGGESGSNALYIGIYLDYGLNNIQKVSTRDFLEYNPADPPDYKYNGILQSRIQGQAFTDKVAPFAFGVKIRLAFGGGGKVGASSVKPGAIPRVKPDPVYAK